MLGNINFPSILSNCLWLNNSCTNIVSNVRIVFYVIETVNNYLFTSLKVLLNKTKRLLWIFQKNNNLIIFFENHFNNKKIHHKEIKHG